MKGDQVEDPLGANAYTSFHTLVRLCGYSGEVWRLELLQRGRRDWLEVLGKDSLTRAGTEEGY